MNRRSKILQSPKLIEKKRAKLVKITLIYSLCCLVFISGIFFTLRLDSLQITKINSNVAYSSEITDKVNSILNDSYLYLIPKSNFLFYPKSEIKEALLSSFNNIDSLSVTANGMSSLDIIINERAPTAVACEGFSNDDNSKCYFIDDDGLVYSKSPDSSESLFFRYYLSSKSIDEMIGQNLMGDKDKFIATNNFIDSIKRSGLNLTGLLIGEDGQYELYAKNIDNSDMVIYFNDRFPLDKIQSNLIAFIENSKVKKGDNNGKMNFESINLRFGNNIFYVTK